MKIQENISLSDKNWFKTGGLARFYSEPKTEQDLVSCIQFATEKDLDIFMLGGGANILISDDGFDGLVIHPELKDIIFNDDAHLVTAGAGVTIQDLIDACLDNKLVGLEEFSGIPGTVGGSVYINIHYLDYFLSNFLVKACVIEKTTGALLDVDASWFNFGYDQSKLFEKNYFLVTATFKLNPVDGLGAAYAKGRRDETIRHRNRRYPMSNTCGSFFRNFHKHELSCAINCKKLPYVAYYLDKLGIKGELAVGNVIVSHQHANMLVTQQGATSAQVIALARKMQQMVSEQFCLTPHVECQLVGFKENPFTV